MRVLVTGACGFLGWNLTRELRRRHPDAYIVGVDNLWTGCRRSGEAMDLVCEMDAEYMPHTVFRQAAGTFNYVYHLASPASPPKYQSAPLRTIRANVHGLAACLDMLAPTGTLLFASSSEVYGDPIVTPQPESYRGQVNCVGPRACYDESKRLGETICYEWTRANPGQVCKIARLFNVYGPGTLPDDGRAVSNFIWDAMRGRTLVVHGSGAQTRAFTYVDDVIRALVRLAEETGSFTGPINIGTNVETSVVRLARYVREEVAVWRTATGRLPERIGTVCGPPVVDDPRQRLPDLTLAQQVLGWDPPSLVQLRGSDGGIQRTIRHFEEMYLAADNNHPWASDQAANPALPA